MSALTAPGRWAILPALLLVATCRFAAAQDAGQDAAQDAAARSPGGQADAQPQTAQEEASAPALSPRARYNLGLERLAADPEAAADAFLAARDEAGPDPQLRYRAAFNLGVALAAQADRADDAADAGAPEGEAAGQAAADEKVIDLLRQSAAWFNDAVRLAPPGDDAARINLELISRRILQLADQLNAGDKLERRLDRLIDDQRGVRDQVRRLLAEVVEQNAGAEPLGFKTEFEALASRQRVLMAEVGDGIDLAAEERLFIEQTPTEQRTPEQQSRAHRLAALTDYLERARQSLSDARRRLRRLQGERGHRRADAALAELKRAREQLRDPVTVLGAVARDEAELIGHTGALAAFQDPLAAAEAGPPGWLTAKHLRDRQEDAAARAGGVLGMFEAMLATSPDAAPSPDAAGVRAAVEEAAPVLERGLAHMRDAIGALANENVADALQPQNAALAALGDVIELFADTKQLIELAYAGQRTVVALLDPDAAAGADAGRPLDEAERGKLLGELVFAGQRRVGRLETLLANDRAAQMDAEQADEQTQEAARQRFDLAEQLRADAEEGLLGLAEALDAIAAGGGDVASARRRADATLATLTDLRRLFFTIVQHLQALLEAQAETHDQTASAQFESTVDKLDALPAELTRVAERQARHLAIGEQLATALAEHADATPPSSDDEPPPSGAPADVQLGDAAEEVRAATGRMNSAATLLADAAARAAAMSPELEPALADQTAAMEHLENALRALAPPNQQTGGEQGGDQQGGEQQQAAQQAQQPQEAETEEERMSQRQALRRLQAIRDREAERQRRRQAADAGREPVEKDW